MKLKAALKDVARVHRVPHSIVNYITAMIDDGTDWTGLFRQAAFNRKLRDFIQTYPLVIEDVQGLLGQPKAASIHASAIVVTPDTRDGRPAECFDFLPVRKMDGALVSEFDGYSVDEIGLLKEDVLATKELAKLSAVIALVNRNFGQELTIGRITQDMLEDGKTYRLLSDGNTQNVFQFSSPGITRFIQDVQPECIEDLIAINALYRPATLDIGATDDYVRFRRGEVAPVYNYGCYEATKNTFGIMVYQEQFMSVAHTLGGFDLGKTDYLRKAIGKKKADLMATLKADFIAGAVGNGCPDYEAEEIWHKIEVAGKYSFNRSHAAAYALTAYCGAWLKANYPSAVSDLVFLHQQIVQRAFDIAFESVGYVDIPFRCLDVVMSHKLFHNLDVGSLLQQVGGERMAQQVRINPFRDSRFPGRCLQPFRHDTLGERFARSVFKKPHFRFV